MRKLGLVPQKLLNYYGILGARDLDITLMTDEDIFK